MSTLQIPTGDTIIALLNPQGPSPRLSHPLDTPKMHNQNQLLPTIDACRASMYLWEHRVAQCAHNRKVTATTPQQALSQPTPSTGDSGIANTSQTNTGPLEILPGSTSWGFKCISSSCACVTGVSDLEPTEGCTVTALPTQPLVQLLGDTRAP